MRRGAEVTRPPVPGPAPGAGAVPRPARLFAYGFLALLLVTSTGVVEAWPFTGWRLFSHVRSGTVTTWPVVAVGGDGTERALDLSAYGRGFRGASWLARRFPGLAPARRAEVCQAWADAAARSGGAPVEAVRVYQSRRPSPPRPGGAGPPTERLLLYECQRR